MPSPPPCPPKGGGVTRRGVRMLRELRLAFYPPRELVVRLQRAWQQKWAPMRARALAETVIAGGLTSSHLRGMGLDAAFKLVRQRPLQMQFKALLLRVHHWVAFRHCPSVGRGVGVNVIEAMSAFMLAVFPSEYFVRMEGEEGELWEAAKALVGVFDEVNARLAGGAGHAGMPRELMQGFYAHATRFAGRYRRWRPTATLRFARGARDALLDLYRCVVNHLPTLEAGAGDDHHYQTLRTELMAGIRRQRDNLTRMGQTAMVEEMDALFERMKAEGADRRMSNEQLGYELAMDPEFKFKDHLRHDDGGMRCDWKMVEDDLRWPGAASFVRVMPILTDICDGFGLHRKFGVTQGMVDAHRVVSEVDMGFIKQQAERGLWGFGESRALVEMFVGAIRMAQDPARAGAMEAGWAAVKTALEEFGREPAALCLALRFVLTQANLMIIDDANRRMRQLAPTMRLHGADYLRDKFKERLEVGATTLERTTAWVREALRSYRDHRPSGLAQTPQFADVHMEGLLLLVTTPMMTLAPAVPQEATFQGLFPETLKLDVARLVQAQHELAYLTTAATVLAVLEGTTLVESKETTTAKQARMAAISEVLVKLRVKKGANVEATVMAEVGALLVEGRAYYGRLLESSLVETSAVRQLMRTRLIQQIRPMLCLGRLEAGFRPVSSALLPRTAALVWQIVYVAQLNRAVHERTYDALIREAMTRAD